METPESIDEFFQAHVDRACRSVGVAADPRTEHYLVQLLSGYAGHGIDDTPLALRLMDAQQSAPAERRAQLREIGDTSLYVSGFWFESFSRRAINVDYYIGMGESAYSSLARATAAARIQDPGGDVYDELARKFDRFVRVLTVISEMVMPENSPHDVIRLYERWRKTGSRWAERRLAALGVTVTAAAVGKPQ